VYDKFALQDIVIVLHHLVNISYTYQQS